ncbi:MAG: NUDIX domain-containing protein, partial [Comamonadaceae bacterium]|nr:NUDIX domain-containing protein [Comamonadaceae bacterium]
VLLIRRAHAPGKGLWALPGGFLEPQDTLWQSCLRELQEETHWPLDAAAMQAVLRAVRVFDHPGRSQRGRTVTHVHYFDLGAAALPPVRGGDDAAQAQWQPIASLAALEDAFFEDHFHVLRQFLPLG